MTSSTSGFDGPRGPLFMIRRFRTADARARFELESAAAGIPVSYTLGDVLFTSPPGSLGVRSGGTLDVTVVRLADLPASYRGLATAPTLNEGIALSAVRGKLSA